MATTKKPPSGEGRLEIRDVSWPEDTQIATVAPLAQEKSDAVVAIASLRKNSHSEILVSLNFARGEPRIAIREHSFDGLGLASTPKGVTLPAAQLDDLIGALVAARNALLAEGAL
jgi:hypothetical protein